jgi:hypothetical protein
MGAASGVVLVSWAAEVSGEFTPNVSGEPDKDGGGPNTPSLGEVALGVALSLTFAAVDVLAGARRVAEPPLFCSARGRGEGSSA